jgi:hypothetical protein
VLVASDPGGDPDTRDGDLLRGARERDDEHRLCDARGGTCPLYCDVVPEPEPEPDTDAHADRVAHAVTDADAQPDAVANPVSDPDPDGVTDAYAITDHDDPAANGHAVPDADPDGDTVTDANANADADAVPEQFGSTRSAGE